MTVVKYAKRMQNKDSLLKAMAEVQTA